VLRGRQRIRSTGTWIPSFNRYFGWYWGDYDMFGPYIDRTHSFTNLPAASANKRGCKPHQHMDDPPKPGKPNDAGVPHYGNTRTSSRSDLAANAGTTLPLAESHLEHVDFASDGRVESTSPGRNTRVS